MKNKKVFIIIGAVLVLCVVLTVCGIGGWLIYQNSVKNAEARAKALVDISDTFSKTKVDFLFLESYFTDNGLYSENLTKHQTSIDTLTTDISFNKSILDVLSADSKTKLNEYYTKIATILATKKNQNANYDLYNNLFVDPNSKYNQSMATITTVYKHKVESLADVADIISVYNGIITTRQEVKAEFLAIDIPEEQQAYKTFITDWIDL